MFFLSFLAWAIWDLGRYWDLEGLCSHGGFYHFYVLYESKECAYVDNLAFAFFGGLILLPCVSGCGNPTCLVYLHSEWNANFGMKLDSCL